jgi:nucleotide-binding universal stress UspA family protein
MELKNILVHVDGTDRAAVRIRTAANLAAKTDAQVTGVFVVPDPYIGAYMAGGYVPVEIFEQQRQQALKEADEASNLFEDITGKSGIRAEWRIEEGTLADVLARHVRYADIAVVGKGDPEDPIGHPHPELAGDLAMTAGRPVLVIPNAGTFDEIGKRVLVCWNASREAARAVQDAMPMLEAAEKVTILAVNPTKQGDHGDIPCADIALHLARHGIKAEATSTSADGIGVADAILARASDLGADLIVTGAYGHSRTREWVFGGVTESLMRNMTVPALMSH